MALVVGQKLGSYEILSLPGKGGMGEVYRARDTKLKRDVAIKILPDEFSRASAPFGQDITADGRRFLFVTPVVGDAQAPITIVLNWTAALKK